MHCKEKKVKHKSVAVGDIQVKYRELEVPFQSFTRSDYKHCLT